MTAVIVVLFVIVFVGVVVKNLFADGRRSTGLDHLAKATEQDQSRQKPQKPDRNVRKGHNATNRKTKADKTNAKLDTAAVLAGAALVHQMRKHHKHDDANDIDDDRFDPLDDEFDDLYDHDLYDDLDTQDYEDNYEYERAAYEEEQAAYDDFIASLDMADD